MHEGVTSEGEGAPPEAGLLGRTPTWALAALVFLVALVSYWPCLRGGLLWDDAAHVTREDLRPLEGLVRIWTHLRETQQYYPVLHSAFWIEYRLWGGSTLGYHLVNVGLHGLNACLLASLLAGLRFPRGAAWFAALLFATHPVCVESVAWISEQKNTLSLAFYLLSARAFLGFSESRRMSSYLAASLLFCAALGTKSVTATLPASLLVVLWWRRGGISMRRDVAPLLPWFLVAGASGALTAWVERHVVGAEGAAFDLAPVERLLLAGRVVWFYLGKLLWPSNLMFIYPHWKIDSGDLRAWAPLAAAGALTAGLWLMRGRLRGACAGWLFFIGSLLPAMGFVSVFPFLYSYVADHFQYLASLGVFAVAASAASALVGRMPILGRIWARAACAALVAGLAFLSRLQSATYRDSETLYTATLERNPACWMAENNLAAELAERGRTGEALEHYRRALAIRPDYPEAHNNLGNLLAGAPGSEAEAQRHFEEALRLRPDFAEAHTDLANLLARMPGRETEAESHYERALRIHPADATAHYDLALLLSRMPGRDADAARQYRASLGLRPDSAEAHNNLGILLARGPSTSAEALAEFSEAVRLDPRFASAYVNMAILELHQGRGREAAAACEKALQVDPSNGLALRILEGLKDGSGR
jgi:tetratricopeptide (TPR) repeat protein